MPITLTVCSICSLSRPEFRCALQQLLKNHPRQLELSEVECMAACDDVPAVLVDYQYHPQLTATEFEEVVLAALGKAS